MEQRKIEEQQFHDMLRSDATKLNNRQYKGLTSNKKFYSIDKINKNYVYNLLKEYCPNKRTLDYCCGDEDYSRICVQYGAKKAHGIDVSPVAVENCQKIAKEMGLSEKTEYKVMDAENLEFDDNYFNVITCMGVLHHLNFEKAMQELSRVLKPNGITICTEPLAYNPIIQLYRRKTPHLRTEFEAEHLIRISDIKTAKKYFNKVKVKYFHLATIAAVPLRNTFLFQPVLAVLRAIDKILLSLPLVKMQAWMIIMELSEPKK